MIRLLSCLLKRNSQVKERSRKESIKNPSSASVSSKGSAKSRKKTETASEKAEKKNNVNESEDESEQEKDADEEEPEEEAANGVPERSAKQMSDQGESDEENESEDKLSPIDDELCGAIGEILREEDIPTTNLTAILERLCKRFGTDLTPRKSHIMIMITFQLTELGAEDDDNED